MLTVTADRANHVAILEPHDALTAHDFRVASDTVDAMIAESGTLSGIIVSAASFPGWNSFAELVEHLRFVRDHHQKLPRVALVTDSIAAHLAEVFSTHFVKAEVRIFPRQDMAAATRWVVNGHV